MYGLLGYQQPQGLLGPSWGLAGAGSMAYVPQQPEYGSDEWAAQNYGPGGLLWRQIMGGLSSKNPYNVFDPAKADRFFSPDMLGFLGPQYQDQM